MGRPSSAPHPATTSLLLPLGSPPRFGLEHYGPMAFRPVPMVANYQRGAGLWEQVAEIIRHPEKGRVGGDEQ